MNCRSLLAAVFVLLAAGSAFGYAIWDPDVRLTENDWSDFNFWSCQKRVAVDPEGRVHAAWYVMNSGLGSNKFQIYYARYNPGTGWTADTMVSGDLYASGLFCKYPSIAVDSTGRVWLAWAAGADDGASDAVYYKTCQPEGTGNGGWASESRMVSVNPSTADKACPNIACSPDGRVHVTWLEGNSAYIGYRERVDTTWQEQVNLDPTGFYKVYPSLAVGRDNSVHVAWHGRTGPSGFYNVFHIARHDTTWTSTENVSYGSRHQTYPTIAVNPTNNEPHILWQGQEPSGDVYRLIHSYRTGGAWQPRDTVSEAGLEITQGTGQIVLTDDGRAHAAWSGKSTGSPSIEQLRYAERTPAGDWLAPVNITDTTSGSRSKPSIASGGSSSEPNHLHVVWTDYRDGNSEFYYKHGAPGSGFQAESVLPTVTRLTLSPSVVTGRFVRLKCGTRVRTGERYLVYDAVGSIVREGLGVESGLDVGGLAAGVYLVEVKLTSGSAVGRFVVTD